MAYYRDLREHIAALEANNKLVRVGRPINKDTELMPLVRWQFRGLAEDDRKAFLFENVTDAKGRKYTVPALVASHAASRQIYAIGMMCGPSEIMERWTKAQLNPIPPKRVESGPCQEEVHLRASLCEHGGLEEFPIPISTPGLDNAPYLTCANWVTKDPDTGRVNVGNYRAMVKSPTRLGICSQVGQHIRKHWDKCREKGIPLQAAIVIGASPNIGYTSAAKLPYDLDEYSVSGGLAGQPVELVKCKTVDIEVPATAEIVIEGLLPTDSMEREAPFGEFSGYMGSELISPYFVVTAITHRKDAIYNAFISQFPPSESSKLRQVGYEATLFKYLRYDSNLPSVLDVGFHETAGSALYAVIQMGKSHQSETWQALYGSVTLAANTPKFSIVVDDDIDPRDADSVNWALSFRVQPHRDIRIVEGRTTALDPSGAPGDASDDERRYPGPGGASAILINATRNWDYPPVSLPRKEYMEKAKKIWEEMGLPRLKPKAPWFGYELGDWSPENREEADLAVQGDYFVTGEKLAGQRIILPPAAGSKDK
ncbi:MAG: UbiD family decarboxylase [Desulfobacterales bacterium]|nr:UbiD family decarboxylase [Desulfobacterales bacterium]